MEDEKSDTSALFRALSPFLHLCVVGRPTALPPQLCAPPAVSLPALKRWHLRHLATVFSLFLISLPLPFPLFPSVTASFFSASTLPSPSALCRALRSA